jgi:hypothetical protein
MHVRSQRQEEAKLTTPNPRPQPHIQQRRSQRILLSISILVSGERPNGAAFSERTKTQIVNAHGALIHLHEPVLAGQQVRVKNLMTNEEINCTIADISASAGDVPEVGLSFAKPTPSFWRVSFPPEDWSPRSPDAKRISSIPMPAKPAVVKK